MNFFNQNNSTTNPSFPSTASIPDNGMPSTFSNLEKKIFQSSGDQKLDALEKIQSLYSAYDPNSPNYKFFYVFYSAAKTKFTRTPNFTEEEWKKVYINETLMPVKLNREQVMQRRRKQIELIIKLNESRYAIIDSINKLKFKKEMIINKYMLVLSKYREYARLFVSENIEPLEVSECHLYRNKYYVEQKDACVSILKVFKKRLTILDNNIEDLKQLLEKRSFSTLHYLNRNE